MIRLLAEDVRCRLRSGVALTSVAQCVEELLLNSLDAGATCLAVRVDLEELRVQVVDNGCGVCREDLELLGGRYFTSKCQSAEDLEELRFSGFRGEAIASMVDVCSVVEICSRHRGTSHTFQRLFQNGKPLEVVESESPRASAGTTVTLHKLFSKMPVRRKCLEPALELERIRQRVEAVSLVQPAVSFSLRNEALQSVLLQLPKAKDTRRRFCQIYGSSRSQSLREVRHTDGGFTMEGLVSREGHYNRAMQFLYVNNRLVLKTQLHKLMDFIIRRESSICRGRGGRPRSAADLFGIFIVNIQCRVWEYDICFQPDKTLIEFQDWDGVMLCTERGLRSFLHRENLFLAPSKDDTEQFIPTHHLSCESGEQLVAPQGPAHPDDSANLRSRCVHRSSDITEAESPLLPSNGRSGISHNGSRLTPPTLSVPQNPGNPGSPVPVQRSISKSAACRIPAVSADNAQCPVSRQKERRSSVERGRGAEASASLGGTLERFRRHYGRRDGWEPQLCRGPEKTEAIDILPSPGIQKSRAPGSSELNPPTLSDCMGLNSQECTPKLSTKLCRLKSHMEAASWGGGCTLAPSTPATSTICVDGGIESPCERQAARNQDGGTCEQQAARNQDGGTCERQAARNQDGGTCERQPTWNQDGGTCERQPTRNQDGGTCERQPTRNQDGGTCERQAARNQDGGTCERQAARNQDDGTCEQQPARNQDGGTCERQPARNQDGGTCERQPARNQDGGTCERQPARNQDGGTCERQPARNQDGGTCERQPARNQDGGTCEQQAARNQDDGTCERQAAQNQDGGTCEQQAAWNQDGGTCERQPARNQDGGTCERQPARNQDNGTCERRAAQDQDGGTCERQPARNQDNGTCERQAAWNQDGGTCERQPARNQDGGTCERWAAQDQDGGTCEQQAAWNQDGGTCERQPARNQDGGTCERQAARNQDGGTCERQAARNQDGGTCEPQATRNQDGGTCERQAARNQDYSTCERQAARNQDGGTCERQLARNQYGGTCERQAARNQDGGTCEWQPARNQDGGTCERQPARNQDGGTCERQPARNQDGGTCERQPARNQDGGTCERQAARNQDEGTCERQPAWNQDGGTCERQVARNQDGGTCERQAARNQDGGTCERQPAWNQNGGTCERQAARNQDGGTCERQAARNQDGGTCERQPARNQDGGTCERQAARNQGGGTCERQPARNQGGGTCERQAARNQDGGTCERQAARNQDGGTCERQPARNQDGGTCERQPARNQDGGTCERQPARNQDGGTCERQPARNQDGGTCERQPARNQDGGTCERQPARNQDGGTCEQQAAWNQDGGTCERSSEELVSLEWLQCYEESLGKNVFINTATGLSSYSAPTRDKTAVCTQDVSNVAVTVVGSKGFRYQCHPLKSRALTPFLPRPRDDRGPAGQTDNGALSSMYTEWKNPVYERLPALAVDVSRVHSDSQSVKIHNILYPYRFTKEMVHSIEVLQQVDSKFIVCLMNATGGQAAAASGAHLLVLVDQHAAHERVRLEQLIADSFEASSGACERQLKVSVVDPPLEVQVSEEDYRVLRTRAGTLRRVGLSLSVPDTGTPRVLLSEIPLCFVEREASEMRRGRSAVLQKIVQEYLQEQVQLLQVPGAGHGAVPGTVLKVLASQACHGAVKFNQPLTVDECRHLLHSLGQCSLPFQCAHGRPSILPLADLQHMCPEPEDPPAPNLRRLRRRHQDEKRQPCK